MSQIRFLHYVYNPFNAFCKKFQTDIKKYEKILGDLKIQIFKTESRQNPFCVSFYNDQTSPSFSKYEWDDKSMQEILDKIKNVIEINLNIKKDNDQKEQQSGGSIDYKHKYLKYKAKYLQAQNMN